MATIAPTPHNLNNVIVTIGTDSYQPATSTVLLTPATTLATFNGMTPGATYTLPGVTSWKLSITAAADWENAASLANYLFANAGETVDLTFEPVAGGAGFSAQVILVAPSIGGSVDGIETFTVELGVLGTPTLTPAA